MTTFPRIPTFDAIPGETPAALGLRAFRYLVNEGVPVGLLTREQQEAALHFSLPAVAAPDVADPVRARWHAVRHQLAARLAQPAAETAPPPPPAPQAPTLPGGARVPRPVVPTRPTPPSAAVSAVSGKPLPTAATVAARLAAARQHALPEGDAL